MLRRIQSKVSLLPAALPALPLQAKPRAVDAVERVGAGVVKAAKRTTSVNAPSALLAGAEVALGRARWSAGQANDWYAKQAWLVGANYVPASAINQLEMWQAATWDPARIDRELGWAAGLGMNTMRVFLHDLMWESDREGFTQRIDQFLTIAAKHGIKPLLVLFDSCWNGKPALGPQPAPIPGVHNSGWVQSPGIDRLRDSGRDAFFETYVRGIIGRFAKDERILAWDVWNEPDNSPQQFNDAAEQEQLVAVRLAKVFQWARAAGPVQPLTSGVWKNSDWSKGASLSAYEKVQLNQSDIISFHDYSWPEKFAARVKQLKTHGRPIICTEYMARSVGSTFDNTLPIGKRNHVGMINWGLVDGKSQCRYPWESIQRPYGTSEPDAWFHEVLHADGAPYRSAEADLIRKLTGRGEQPQK